MFVFMAIFNQSPRYEYFNVKHKQYIVSIPLLLRVYDSEPFKFSIKLHDNSVKLFV